MDLYTLDTDIVIEHLRGTPEIAQKMQELGSDALITVTCLTVYELYKGVYVLNDRKKEKEVEQFLDQVGILDLNLEAEKKAGETYADLRKDGNLINDADILISSLALTYGSILVTNNTEHFKRVKGLKLENWLEETAQ